MKDNRKGVKFRSDQWRLIKEWYDLAHPLIEDRDILNGDLIKDKDGNQQYEARMNVNDAITYIFEELIDGYARCHKHQDTVHRWIKYKCPLCHPVK